MKRKHNLGLVSFLAVFTFFTLVMDLAYPNSEYVKGWVHGFVILIIGSIISVRLGKKKVKHGKVGRV